MSFPRSRHLCQINDILYDLVTRALGDKSVKCILSDDECLFTPDVETLLSSLDTEHPEIEIILQSLKSHKAQYGESVRSFLFMVTRMTKAVKQLEQLGIADCISTRVLQEAVSRLSKEVHTISLPVVNFKITDDVQQPMKRGVDGVLEHALPVNNLFSLKCPDQQQAKEVGSPEQKSKLQSSKFVTNRASNDDSESSAVNPSTEIAESDFVYLKMSNCSLDREAEKDGDVDNVEWFFNSKKTTNFSVHNESHDIPNIESGLSMISNKLGEQVMNMVNGKKSTGREFYSGFLGIAHMNKNGIDIQESHLKLEKDNHDSDFEDCFDDVGNEKHVTVEAANKNKIDSVSNRCKSNSFSHLKEESSLNSKRSQLKGDSEELSHISYSTCKTSSQIEDHEFDECFGDIDKRNLDQETDPLCLNEIQDATSGNSKQNVTQDNFTQNKTMGISENERSDSKDHPSGKDVSASSEITKLNSLLKQIDNSRTHNVQQVMFSTRHEVKEGNSKECTNQDQEILNITKSSSSLSTIHTESIKLSGTSEKDSNESAQSSKTIPVLMSASQIRSSGASKIKEINTLLKSFSARKSTVNLAGVVASSRHIDRCQEPKKETTSRYITSHSKSEPDLDCMKQKPSAGNVMKCVSHEDEPKFSISHEEFHQDCDVDSESHAKLMHDDNCMNKKVTGDCGLVDSSKPSHVVHFPKDINVLCREDENLKQLITETYSCQNRDDQPQRLDLSKVHCVSVQSSRCVREVVQGLVIPCSSHTMEMIGTSLCKRKTLVVNADLRPGFVHKGHKPVVAKKEVVGSTASLECSSVGHEHSWAAKALDVIRKLSVEVLLVKGRISDTLSDMLFKENIAVLSRVPFRVLEIISRTHKVTPLIYIQDAAMSDLCLLSYQPIDECWMDRDVDSHCLVVSNMPQIQTIVLELPSTQSCHVEEERAWKCLHRLSNALNDGRVLPGCGETELWCSRRVRDMSQHWADGFCPQNDLILQAIADVFQDYVSFVRLNVKPTEQECQERHNRLSLSQDSKPDGLVVDKKGTNLYPSYFDGNFRYRKSFVDELDIKSLSGGNNVDGNANRTKHLECGFECDADNPLRNRHSGSCSGARQCDSFMSKVSSWSSAVDLVQVLLSLDSLVVTGASSSNLNVGDVLL